MLDICQDINGNVPVIVHLLRLVSTILSQQKMTEARMPPVTITTERTKQMTYTFRLQ